MRIGLVTTYPPTRCGIATYSENLARAMVQAESDAGDDVDVFIAAERGAAEAIGPGTSLRVVPCFDRREAYDETLLDALLAARVDVAHIQHAPDIFGMDERLPRLLRRLAEAGIPSVVTMHTVYHGGPLSLSADARHAEAYHRRLASPAHHGPAHLIVHHETIRGTLADQGVARERTTAIPHGTTLATPLTQREARRALGLPEDGVLFLHFGFIHAQKNVHTALMGFLLATKRATDERLPEAYLVVAGSAGGERWYNKAYIEAMKLGGVAAGGRDRVLWRDGFVASEDVARYFAAADVVLLPHAHQPYGSASGVFHLAMGAGRAVIASREPKFRELMELTGMPETCSVNALCPRGWAKSIGAMATDPELRKRSAAALADYARETSWSAVARQHLAVYRSLL